MLFMYIIFYFIIKKVNRKAQGAPQPQTAANPRYQEEEKNDKNNTYKNNNKQTHEKHTDQHPLPKRGDHNAKRNEEKRGQRAREYPKTRSTPQHKLQSNTEQEQHRDHRLRTVSSINHLGGGGVKIFLTVDKLHPGSRCIS